MRGVEPEDLRAGFGFLDSGSAKLKVVLGSGKHVAGDAPSRGPGTVAGSHIDHPDRIAERQSLLNQAAARQHFVIGMGSYDEDAFVR